MKPILATVISWLAAIAMVAAGSSLAYAASPNLMIGTDMGHSNLYLFNMDTDQRIKVDLSQDPMWPGGGALHTVITKDGKKAYLSVMSTEKDPATVLVLKVDVLDWEAGKADVKITKVLRAGEPGEDPSFLIPTQTDPKQPVTDLWKVTRLQGKQLHGPTIHPNGKFIYFTEWTDNKIRVVDVDKNEWAAVDPIQYGTRTRQIHGVFFNPSGDLAIATGYYYDMNEMTVYKVDKETGNLTIEKVIPLTISEKDKEYAAFTHFVWWLDDRLAVTGTQQTGNTSLTPIGWKVIGPSVWLIDAIEGKGKMIIGPAENADDPAGIFKAGSDVVVVGKKLYVGEEDSMGATKESTWDINDSNWQGNVSVWDMSDPSSPKFIKRLQAGKELPADFKMTHEVYASMDGRHVYAQSWASGHLVKLDGTTDEVVGVITSKDAGWHMPHGNFVPGQIR
jgi:DNA-binding beta-propeller fold protein YncE